MRYTISIIFFILLFSCKKDEMKEIQTYKCICDGNNGKVICKGKFETRYEAHNWCYNKKENCELK